MSVTMQFSFTLGSRLGKLDGRERPSSIESLGYFPLY